MCENKFKQISIMYIIPNLKKKSTEIYNFILIFILT